MKPNTKRYIIIVNDKFILYQDNLGSFPIGLIAKYFIKKSPEYNPDKVKVVNLIQPELQKLLRNDKRAEIVEWIYSITGIESKSIL